MARIKEPTLKELMDASRMAAKHLSNVKKRVLAKLDDVVRAWEQENFPIPEGATVYMEGETVMPISNKMGEDCHLMREKKFHWPDLDEPNGKAFVTFKARMGLTSNTYPMKYDGNALSVASYYIWNSPDIRDISPQQEQSMEESLEGYRKQHRDALALADGVPEGWKVPRLGDLLESLARGEFGANHNAVFNKLNWSTYVSGRSKKTGQLNNTVDIPVRVATNIAEEIVLQRTVADIMALFEGTRFALLHDAEGGSIKFKPCETLPRTDAGDKRNTKTYLEAGRRKRL